MSKRLKRPMKAIQRLPMGHADELLFYVLKELLSKLMKCPRTKEGQLK
jgi:hypothetical protein